MVADEVKQISAVPGVEPKDPLLKQMSDNYDKNGSPYLLLTDFRYGSPSGTELLGKGVQELLLGYKDAPTVSKEPRHGRQDLVQAERVSRASVSSPCGAVPDCSSSPPRSSSSRCSCSTRW